MKYKPRKSEKQKRIKEKTKIENNEIHNLKVKQV
jgi:hypothetical protein